MRIVVAGSSGLIGTALVPALREAGHEVRRLVRRETVAADEYRWDPAAGTVAPGTFDGVDAVVNLCGSPLQGRWSAARKQDIRDSRISATRVLAEAVAEHGVPALLNSSDIGFYGNTGDVSVDESSGEGAGFLAELAVDWETAAKPARDAGCRVVLMRNGLVMTAAGGLLGGLLPLYRLGLGGRHGSGRQFLAWISMPDEVAAIRFLLEHQSLSGPVNLCGPAPVTNAEFSRVLARALRRPALLPVPRVVLRAALGEAAEELALVSMRAHPRVLRDAGFEFQHGGIENAFGDIL